MSKVFVPPVKCQGIKTKLVPLILANTDLAEGGVWCEPFMGSGVVGFNVRPKKALFSDINPHIIAFYEALKRSAITPETVRTFLENEGLKLRERGEAHFYFVRERFNQEFNPLDFLFLSRSCFNGMIRFNKSGEFNVPFCRKPRRFTAAYITKIVNQVRYVWEATNHYDWQYDCIPFESAIEKAGARDLIYCDPPYLGRHVDYYDSWSERDERLLHWLLSRTSARFILSTWHSNRYRRNPMLDTLWADFNIVTKEHFYHVGAKEGNRNPVLEALVMNFVPSSGDAEAHKAKQHTLW